MQHLLPHKPMGSKDTSGRTGVAGGRPPARPAEFIPCNGMRTQPPITNGSCSCPEDELRTEPRTPALRRSRKNELPKGLRRPKHRGQTGLSPNGHHQISGSRRAGRIAVQCMDTKACNDDSTVYNINEEALTHTLIHSYIHSYLPFFPPIPTYLHLPAHLCLQTCALFRCAAHSER